MKCPVCNSLISPSITEAQEDFYYDCETCYSSLFFQGGECQVLKTNSVYKESLDLPDKKLEEPEEEDIEVPEITQAEEQYLEQSASGFSPDSVEEPEEDLSLKEEDLPEKEFQEEAPEESHPFEAATQDNKEEEVSVSSFEQEEQVQNEKDELTASSENREEDSFLEEQEPQEVEEEEFLEEGKENFLEVTTYGNTQNLGREGLFCYDLILSELNSEEVCREVENILENPAFRWDQDLKMEDGVLKIEKISPVKAHVIVKSLIGLPVKIFWKQHLVVESKES